jgi:hypothetical protein
LRSAHRCARSIPKQHFEEQFMDGGTGVIVGILGTIVVLALVRALAPAFFRTLFSIFFTGGASVSNVTATCAAGHTANVTATVRPNTGCSVTGLYAIVYPSATTPPADYPGVGGTYVPNPAPAINANWNAGPFIMPTPMGGGTIIVAVWPEYKTTDTYLASQSFGPCN